jgi:hypothetical protein
MHRRGIIAFSIAIVAGIGCAAQRARADDRTVPSFLNEVVPLLTRAGCNQGACHGKNAGQNGFRLSLRGYAPEQDHASIAREYAGRRISGPVPDESLLLRKALATVPHGGGRQIAPGSRGHRLLSDWLSAGAPGPGADDPALVALELTPAAQTLTPDQDVQLTATAHWSDGTATDVTWLVQFASNDAGVVDVSPAGLAHGARPGGTAVRAQFLGQVAVAVFTLPYDQPISDSDFPPPANVLDEHVFDRLRALRIPPSPAADDAEFLRRAYLDTIGLLPTPEDVRAFLADAQSDKRARLIDALLERPEFDDYWTLQLADVLQNRRERDHDVRGTKGVRSFHLWLREQVAARRPWNQIAERILLASGPADQNPAVGWHIVAVGEQPADQSEVVAAAAQAFLGTRIGCAKCHNHPLERFTQDDYYHFAGFFSRERLQRRDPQQGATVLAYESPADGRVGVTQPRTGQFLAPRPLDRSELAIDPIRDPRLALAAWITSPLNEQFAGAMVNRLWRHYLGVGLVEPVDDLRSTNPPSNPALWDALCREFAGNGFDLRHVMRLILNSRTYQLASRTRPENETDARFYSHYYARRLPAEVLLDAISTATGVPERFPGYPLGIRAVQAADPGVESYFLGLFGRSARVTACACERTGEVTMPQLLHLQNGEDLAAKIAAPEGRLTALLSASADHDAAIEELFLATLSREPRSAERDAVEAALAVGAPREAVLGDLLWALVNSKEFVFNH